MKEIGVCLKGSYERNWCMFEGVSYLVDNTIILDELSKVSMVIPFLI